MKKLIYSIWETVKIVLLALIIVLPIRYFIFQPFLVKGQSMEPNFQDNNYLVIDELSFRFRQPERGEVIVFRYPYNPSQRYIKRIIGLPGETVEIKDQQIKILNPAGKQVILDENIYLPPDTQTLGQAFMTLGSNEYFVLGDNRQASSDSRAWGVLPRQNIIGRVLFRLLPFSEITVFAAPAY